MLLKNIEIKGFKSFADKTVVHFNDRITGIVGPNGCGKSNVVDAIRWVLGETRSSALRSDKMDNLIFNGTKRRKAAGIAQVSLTFENTKNLLPTEFSTVKITRVLHRTGESEYKLNDVNCRLKDIRNLFMDTGVSNDSYAIIELKMIDDILNDQENSRKRLFDNAAGISKYKKRKHEALNKLKSTRLDLDRVQDLLHEIENNMKIYEKQAKRAEKFKDIKAKYRDKSLHLAQLNLANINNQFEELDQRINTKKDEHAELSAKMQEKEAEITQQKTNILNKEKALADTQRILNEHLDLLRSKENEKNITNENLKFLNQQLNTFNEDLKRSEKYSEELNVEIQQLEKNLNEEKIQLQSKESEMERNATVLEEKNEAFLKASNAFNELKEKFSASEKEVYELEKKIAVNESQKEAIIKELQAKNQQLGDREQEILNLRKEIAVVEKDLTKSETELKSLQKKEDQQLAKLEELSSKIDVVQNQLQIESRKLDKTQNEYNLLKDLVDKLEGFPESIRFLSKNKKWSKAAPLLSDIINCQDDYKIAIENYLEPYLNYYVVNDLKEGIEAINLLSDAAKGRANFFVLNQIQSPSVESFIPTDGAVIATEIIEFDSKYNNLVALLLGNVYLVEDIDADQLKNLAMSDKNVYITKSGKIISTPNSISGGSIGLFEGKKLGRAQKLKGLSKDIKKLEEVVTKLQKQLNELQSQHTELKRSDIRHKIGIQTQSYNKLNNNFISTKTRLENLENFIRENQDKKTDFNDQVLYLDKQISTIGDQLGLSSESKGKLQEEINRSEEKYNKISGSLNEQKEMQNQFNIECIELRNKIDAIKQNLQFKNEQLEEQKSRFTGLQESIQQNRKESEDMESRLKTDDSGLQGLYDQREVMAKDVVTAETAYFSSKEVIDKLDDHLRKFNRDRQKVELKQNELNNEVNDFKMQLISLKDRISIEFATNLEELAALEFEKEDTIDNLDYVTQRLKKRIDNYGEVNPMAIEAYNEIKERFDFITEQKNDLEAAKESILETISEIETTATEKFLEAFELIRTNFINVFHKLFSEEDTCDLVLIDPENPLDSKINIIAKPKGKRPLTINQLSGGEKTLTAISLVFALYLLKPAPFCVLDEVDAPLDDANIAKYNDIIRNFSDGSQFIIVTHNKQTMAKVDIIYGVTMAETGISSVVPVDFRNLN